MIKPFIQKRAHSMSRLAAYICCLASFMLPLMGSAQYKKTFHKTNQNHNHYSIENWNGYTAMAGTIFEGESLTDTRTHVMRLDPSGTVVWEREFDFGTDERCFDVCVVDQNKIAITGHADDHILVAIIDQAGTLLSLRKLEQSNQTQSTGFSIIYSSSQSRYYIGGYESSDINDFFASRTGILLALDQNLNAVWKTQVETSGAYSEVSRVVELTGHPGNPGGIFVTGRMNVGQVYTHNSFYSYSGGQIWSRNNRSTNVAETGGDAAYDPVSDELFVMGNNSIVHTFTIHYIQNATSSTPTLSTVTANLLRNVLNVGTVSGLAIEIDPNDHQLIVAGMTNQMQRNGVLTDNSPTFIAKVGRYTGDVIWYRYLESDNEMFRNHDHIQFSAFDGFNPYVKHPDILAIGGTNEYRVVGYETQNSTYAVNLMTTNSNGHFASSVETCQKDYTAPRFERNPTTVGSQHATASPGFASNSQNGTLVNDPHQVFSDCPDFSSCEAIIEGFTQTNIGCYNYEFNLSLLVGSSTNFTIVWDWGDGSTTTTTGTSTATHQFNAASDCEFEVCATITGTATDGGQCTDEICFTAEMFVTLQQLINGCYQCDLSANPGGGPGGPPIGGWKTGEEANEMPNVYVYPNPAQETFTIDLKAFEGSGELILINMFGQEVRHLPVVNVGSVTVDVSDLATGNYLLKGTGNLSQINQMIVIQ